METPSDWRTAALGALSAKEAARCWREYLWLRPDDRDAVLGLGMALLDSGEPGAAVETLQSWLRRHPDDGTALLHLACCWLELAEWDKAGRTLDRLEEDGDVQALRQRLAAERGTLPPRFARHLFNDYAPRFDEELARLEYKVPALIAEELGTKTGLRVLDLGCGTGQMGAHLKPLSHQLIGLDIAEKMLEEAAKRGVYDVLVAEDAIAYLAAARGFDLIVAADVLVYLGDLLPVLRGAAAALETGGRLIFSVELGEVQDGFVPQESRRFAHSQSYLEQAVAAAGLTLGKIRPIAPRLDRGQPLKGAILDVFKTIDAVVTLP